MNEKNIGLLTKLPTTPPDKTGWPWTEESEPLPPIMTNGKSWPKISIVTPSYNQGKYIEETIRSVLLQNYPNLEYIIIDGGSTDESVDIIKKYEPWLTYWVSEKDRRQAHAINKGFNKASGEILGYINSDDFYLRSGLFLLVNRVRGEIIEKRFLLAAPVSDFAGTVEQKKHTNLDFGRIDQWLDGGVSLHQPGCLWTMALWQFCGPFREDLHYIFDGYYFTLCRIKGAQFIACSDTLAGFRLHLDSKTTNFLFVQDLFSAEWDLVRKELEGHLSFRQKLSLIYRRNLRENSEFVALALASPPNRKPLYTKICRNPLWIFHRPVSGAMVRIFMSFMKSYISHILSLIGKS